MYCLGLAAAVAMMSPAAGTNEIRPGTISVVAGDGPNTPAAVASLYADAVGQALLRTRFFVLPNPSHSRYVATVEVIRTPRGVVVSNGRQSPAAPALSNGGGGLSFGLASNKTQLRGLVETRLKISISLRSDNHVAWTGQAITVRATGTKGGDPYDVVAALSDALLSRFPYQQQEPLTIP